MNSDQFAGKWKQVKGDVQNKWGRLTNDHVDEINGNYQKLVGKVQEEYGKSKEEAEKEVDEYFS